MCSCYDGKRDLLDASVPVMDIGIMVPVGGFPWLVMAPLSRGGGGGYNLKFLKNIYQNIFS